MTLPTRETIDGLDRAWATQWPRNTAGGVHVGDFGVGTRVLFHQLPTRRRRAEHVLEYADLLLRSRALLSALMHSSEEQQLFAVTRAYELDEHPATDQRDPWLKHFVPATFWRSHLHDAGIPGDPEFPAVYEQIYLSQVTLNDPVLLSLIILAAGDRGSDPLIFPADVSWVLSPCDEGAHLAALDVSQVESLREEFPDWIGEPDRFFVPRRDDSDWAVVVEDVTQLQARIVLDALESSDLLQSGGRVSTKDPQEALNPYIDRRDAQLLRIALSDEPGSVFTAYDQTTRVVTPAEARAEIRDDYFYDNLVEFVDTTGYRDPGEAVDGKLDRRLWDPFQEYTGVDGE